MVPILLAALVVAVAAAVQGAVGFGLNLLAVPVLLVVDPALVPGPALLAGLLLSVLMAGRERALLDRNLGWAVLGLLPGTGLALVLLSAVPADALGITLGLLVLVAVGVSALDRHLVPTRRALLLAGTASGLLSTAAAIGGPPMALLYAREGGPRLRSALSVFFIAAAAVSLGALALAGRFGVHELTASAVLVPAVVAGFLLSGPLRRHVDRGRTRPAVLLLSAVAALGAILQSLLG